MRDYAEVWQDMQDFTNGRTVDSADELWVVEHPPVYTLGQAGKPEHILNPGNIAVVKSDRGGQVTYHGPGQIVIYTLFNIRRAGFGIRELVVRLENAVIDTLEKCDIHALGRRDAPGVYVGEKKIAALGLRVRRGCAYHGLSLNIDMDLKPFQGINPCGYEGLEVTSMQELGSCYPKQTVVEYLLQSLIHHLDTADTLS